MIFVVNVYKKVNNVNANLFKPFTWKYYLIHLEIVKIPKILNYNVEILFKTS